jgi:hypothetical protein
MSGFSALGGCGIDSWKINKNSLSFYLLFVRFLRFYFASMFSVFGQWIGSLQMRMYSEDNLAQVNFEDVQAVVRRNGYDEKMEKRGGASMIMRNEESGDMDILAPLLITTIPITFIGGCGNRDIPLISGTLAPEREEAYVNELLETLDAVSLSEILVIVYGRNAMDKSVVEKAKQMYSLGLTSVCVYLGGMFEWCLLQDVYGEKEFPMDGCGNGGAAGKVEPLLFKGKRLFMDM